MEVFNNPAGWIRLSPILTAVPMRKENIVKTTERYCVVLQTITSATPVESVITTS